MDESDVESTTATSTVVVAWPSPSSGFKLQFNVGLNTTNWTDVGQVPAVVGGENQIIGGSMAGKTCAGAKPPQTQLIAN